MQSHIDSRAIELATEAKQIARDARDQCQREYDGLRVELSQHREETNRRFDKQDAERTAMHAENQVKFSKLFSALYIAIGLGMAVSTLLAPLAPSIVKLLSQP